MSSGCNCLCRPSSPPSFRRSSGTSRSAGTSDGSSAGLSVRKTPTCGTHQAQRELEISMYYSIRHLTKFLYKTPVSESIMETRMHPRSDAQQRCLTFHLSVSPRCRIFNFRDHLGNHVHHFDIPVQHEQLVIVAESLVEIQNIPEIPGALGP